MLLEFASQLNPSDSKERALESQDTPGMVYDDDHEASFFQGSGGDILPGVVRGGLRMDAAVHELASASMASDMYGVPMDEAMAKSDELLDNTEEDQKHRGDILQSMMPDPKTVGKLGQVMGGLSEMVPALAGAAVTAPVGGPLAAPFIFGSTFGVSEKERLQSQGVDRGTAAKVGLISGVVNAVGAGAPAAVGGSLLTRMASGSAINLAVGGIERGGTSKVLEDNGYHDMAQQYKFFDGSAMAVDAIIGAAFGALPHGHEDAANPPPKPLPSDVDAALTLNSTSQLEIDSAPGIPTDALTRKSHIDAMSKATEQMIAGEKVDVSDVLTDTNFIPKQDNGTLRTDLEAAMADEGLSPSQRIASELVARGGPYSDAEARDVSEALVGTAYKRLLQRTDDAELQQYITDRFNGLRVEGKDPHADLGLTDDMSEEQQAAAISKMSDDQLKELTRRTDPEGRTLDQPTIDKTDQGDQFVMPGAEKVGDADMQRRQLEQRAKSALVGSKEQKPMDVGLFGDDAKQKSLFQSKPFYSAVARSVDGMKMNKADGEQWLATVKNMPGVKQEELDWMGLPEFLAGRKGVSKEEVQQFIAQGGVKLEEVTKSESRGFSEVLPELTDPDARELVERVMKMGNERTAAGQAGLAGPYARMQEMMNTINAERGHKGQPIDYDTIDEIAEAMGVDNQPNFAPHVLAGGENYKEMLLTLPPKPMSFDEYASAYRESAPGIDEKTIAERYPDYLAHPGKDLSRDNYRSRHFDEPNILAHIRFNDRVDADGKHVLFLEEVQSDWHQEGRKKGYRKPLSAEERAAGSAREKAIIQRSSEIYDESEALSKDRLPNNRMRDEAKWHDLMKERSALEAEIRDIRHRRNSTDGVADAPFKKTWHELAMKRMLAYAAEHGYDKVAWTTGEQQADRYNLSKHVEQIYYKNNGDGTFAVSIIDKNGSEIESASREDYTPQQIEETIGKEIAKKMQDGEGGDAAAGDGLKFLKGVDLKVGGEGMKGFYDKILPSFINKYAKKWDAKVGKSTVMAGEALREVNKFSSEPTDVHAVDVTPAMRDSVMQGQPLFQGDKRGSITFNGMASIIRLAKADRSTFIHEMGHFYSSVLADIAAHPSAPEGIINDWNTMRDWLGAEEGKGLNRDQEETLARGMELFIHEGKVADEKMRPVFERFAAWMRDIYHSFRDHKVEMSDDVREVFDRLFTDERHVQAARDMGMEFDDIPFDLITDKPHGPEGQRAPQSTFELGEFKKNRFADYSPMGKQQKRVLEGIVRDLNETSRGHRIFVEADGQGSTPEVTGGKGNTPKWFSDYNNDMTKRNQARAKVKRANTRRLPGEEKELPGSGSILTRDKVNTVAEKLMKGEPLGSTEGEVARVLHGLVRDQRDENARQILGARDERQKARKAEQEEEIDAQADREVEMDRAAEIADEYPDMIVMTDDGPMSAADAMAAADEQHAQAEQEAGLFDVAVNCFLRHGQ